MEQVGVVEQFAEDSLQMGMVANFARIGQPALNKLLCHKIVINLTQKY